MLMDKPSEPWRHTLCPYVSLAKPSSVTERLFDNAFVYIQKCQAWGCLAEVTLGKQTVETVSLRLLQINWIAVSAFQRTWYTARSSNRTGGYNVFTIRLSRPRWLWAFQYIHATHHAHNASLPHWQKGLMSPWRIRHDWCMTLAPVARGMIHVEWWKLLDAEISSVLQKVVKSHISLVINLVDSTAPWLQDFPRARALTLPWHALKDEIGS